VQTLSSSLSHLFLLPAHSNSHLADLSSILSRARASHVVAQLITGGSLSESRAALELAAQHDDLYATVGVHPTRAGEFEEHAQGKQGLVRELEEVLEKEEGKVRAIGECGLGELEA
jgi:TatD DNase family protein